MRFLRCVASVLPASERGARPPAASRPDTREGEACGAKLVVLGLVGVGIVGSLVWVQKRRTPLAKKMDARECKETQTTETMNAVGFQAAAPTEERGHESKAHEKMEVPWAELQKMKVVEPWESKAKQLARDCKGLSWQLRKSISLRDWLRAENARLKDARSSAPAHLGGKTSIGTACSKPPQQPNYVDLEAPTADYEQTGKKKKGRSYEAAGREWQDVNEAIRRSLETLALEEREKGRMKKKGDYGSWMVALGGNSAWASKREAILASQGSEDVKEDEGRKSYSDARDMPAKGGEATAGGPDSSRSPSRRRKSRSPKPGNGNRGRLDS